MSAGRDRQVYRVKRMSKAEIDSWVSLLWQLYPTHWTRREAFPLVDFLEVKMLDLFDVDLAIEPELAGGALGETDAKERVVRFPEKVFRGIEAQIAEDCFTAAHEIIHMLLHVDQYVKSRQMGLAMHRRRDLPPSIDPEAQADFGAASLLIPKPFAVQFVAEGHTDPRYYEKRLNASQLAYNLRFGDSAHKRTKPALQGRP